MNVISKYAVTDADKYLRSAGLSIYLEDMSGNAKRKLADYLITIEVRRFNKIKNVQTLLVHSITDYWAHKGVKVQVKRV